MNQQQLLYLGRSLGDDELIDDLRIQDHTPIQCFDLGARSSTPSAISSTPTAQLPSSTRLRVEVCSVPLKRTAGAERTFSSTTTVL